MGGNPVEMLSQATKPSKDSSNQLSGRAKILSTRNIVCSVIFIVVLVSLVALGLFIGFLNPMIGLVAAPFLLFFIAEAGRIASNSMEI